MKTGSVRARGLEFPTLEAGDGPLALCLHGFPDHRGTFRHQLPALAAAGFRAVAPAMRGYAPSAIPADGAYQSAALGEDAVAIIDALGYDDAVVIGHDWGAVAAFLAALAAPRKVRKLVTIAIPYGPQAMMAFATSWAQQRRSWYMFFFNTPFAEPAVMHDDFAFLEHLWSDWSPGWRWPAEAMDEVKAVFRQPGVLAATLGYYRAFLNPALHKPEYMALQSRLMLEPVDVPAMHLHGPNDGCMGVELTDGMAAMFPRGLRLEIVPGTGHFVHQEAPDVVNRLLLDFLRD